MDESGKLYYIISLSFYSLGLTFGLFTFMIILFIYLNQKKLIKLISLRLVGYSGLFQFLIGILFIIRSNYKINNLFCQFVGWSTVFITLLSIFFQTCITINLHLYFIHKIEHSRKIECCYYLFSFILSILLSIPFLISGNFGLNKYNHCFYLDKKTKELPFLIMLLSFELPIIICILYSLFIIIISLILLRKKLNKLQDKINFEKSKQTKMILLNLKYKIKVMIYRVILYCSVPSIIQITSIIRFFYDFSGNHFNQIIWLCSTISLGCGGLILFIFLLIDPAIRNALNIIIIKRSEINNNKLLLF